MAPVRTVGLWGVAVAVLWWVTKFVKDDVYAERVVRAMTGGRK